MNARAPVILLWAWRSIEAPAKLKLITNVKDPPTRSLWLEMCQPRFCGLVSAARQTILDVIRHFLADCRQLEMFLLDERIFGRFGKLSVMGCLIPQVVIPIHARPRSLSSWQLWSAVYPAPALGAIA